MLDRVDLGPPASYLVLSRGMPVYSADEQEVGKLTGVLAAEEEDVFDGIIIETHLGPHGHRFVDAEQVDSIYERGVVLKLSQAQAEHLPEPSANPAALSANPADGGRGSLSDKLRRAWEIVSGKG